MKWTNRVGTWLGVGTTLTILGASGAGCLTRPVGTGTPATKVNYTGAVTQAQIDKIDLLFGIDNSASMADKQAILKDAVPQLLNGLLAPECVDLTSGAPKGRATPGSSASANYGCPDGTQPAFTPISDMHIGVVSSSLGGMGSSNCADDATKNNNDHGRLISRGLSNAQFLAWYPSNDTTSDKDRHPNPPASSAGIGDFGQLQTAFQSVVTGTGQVGCGLEAQLESVYHFLIQPDPWKEVTKDKNGVASIGQGAENVDTDLLKQRADFLRPDSLVAVIMLTDEDDSSADPLALGGKGYTFMDSAPSFKGTKICETKPGDPGCTSCAYGTNASDPNCQNGGKYAPGEDDLNARFYSMKQRYGVDPQYPISRYVDGFTNAQVPDRSTEHVIKSGRVQDYTGTPKCTNPLFAAKLWDGTGKGDYCKLEQGSRTNALIYFAVIGGVPNELIEKFDDKKPDDPAPWAAIVGKDPDNYDDTDISPYMVQSKTPRKGIPGPAAKGDNGTDPIVGRDYDTAGHDLEYACTFKLPEARPPTDGSDCSTKVGNTDLAPPLCNADGTQVKAKAYPTIREFRVVKGLGKRGIIASLCPKTLDGDKNAADYGYNPAVSKIVDRLKSALTQQCLPQQLTRDPSENNEVPCLVLVKIPDKSKKCKDLKLEDPPKDIVDNFRAAEKAAKRDSTSPVCQVPQKAVQKGETCKPSQDPVWCYVENEGASTPAGSCPQALAFSAGTNSLGSTASFSLQCIQQYGSTPTTGGSSSAGDAGN